MSNPIDDCMFNDKVRMSERVLIMLRSIVHEYLNHWFAKGVDQLQINTDHV